MICLAFKYFIFGGFYFSFLYHILGSEMVFLDNEAKFLGDEGKTFRLLK